jgi:hypothetical protein
MIDGCGRFAAAAALASAITVGLGAAQAQGANIAAASGVSIISNSAFSLNGSANNDGNISNTSMYLPDIQSYQQAGFGYEFGGTTTIDSVTVNYDGVSYRPTLETVNVFTSAGEQTITNLTDVYSPDTDGPQTIALSSAVNTSYVYVQPTAYYAHGDPNIGISEVGVNSTTNVIVPQLNLARGKTVTTSGWTGTASGVTDGHLQQPTTGSPTLALNGIVSGNYVQIDLGVPTLTGTIGLFQGAEYNTNADPIREMLSGFTLQFSDDPSFTSLVSSQDLTIARNDAYEQLDYSPVLAQYVRLVADSQDTEGDNAYAGTPPTNQIALEQIQLFAPTPEPASCALVGIAAVGLVLRRRR